MFVLSGSLTPVSLPPSAQRRAGSFPGVNPPGAAARSSPDSSGRLRAGFTGSSKCQSPMWGQIHGEDNPRNSWFGQDSPRGGHSTPACMASGTAAAPRMDAALPGMGTQGMRAQPWALPPSQMIPGTSGHSCSVLDKRCHTPAINQPCSARD